MASEDGIPRASTSEYEGFVDVKQLEGSREVSIGDGEEEQDSGMALEMNSMDMNSLSDRS
jgi:hypothetical protein